MKVSSLLKEVMYGGSKALIRTHFTGSIPVLTTITCTLEKLVLIVIY
jgi:hypothetical protein